MMPDVARPAEMVTIAQMIEEARVSPDRRFTFFYDFDDQGESISVLARNDGTGRCILNAKMGHAAFGVVFPGSAARVLGRGLGRQPGLQRGLVRQPDRLRAQGAVHQPPGLPAGHRRAGPCSARRRSRA